MNILSIDYGKKNIGLAWVETGLNVVLPFGQVKNSSSQIVNQQLINIIQKERIDTIIVGLPLGMDGEENENTKRVRAFGKELAALTNIIVAFVDERFTSQQADRLKGDASRDEKAAMIILQSYIDKEKIRNTRSTS